MNVSNQTIVGELVAQDYRTAAIFKQNGIDFCCKGNRTIDEVCENKKVTADKLITDLNEAMQAKNTDQTDFTSWPIDLLADYVEKRHHRYVVEKTPQILPFLHKIAAVHGGRHPELIEVEELFKGCASELAMHMKKEELIVFPAVRKMVQHKQNNQLLEPAHFGTINNPIELMMAEHENEGDRFRKIAELTNNYTPPADGCSTYRVTFSMLAEFENDLHTHIHLENNILFPKAIALEKALAPNN